MGAPTLVLPGINYSHHLQLAAYQRFFANVPFISWDNLDGYATLPPGIPEEQGVARAVELGTRLAGDMGAREQLRRLLAAVLAHGPTRAPQLHGEHPWSEMDGAVHVADGIAALVRDTKACT
jgi:hypothetical protein